MISYKIGRNIRTKKLIKLNKYDNLNQIIQMSVLSDYLNIILYHLY